MYGTRDGPRVEIEYSNRDASEPAFDFLLRKDTTMSTVKEAPKPKTEDGPGPAKDGARHSLR
jgi:hypothetical protein